ncbi:MAG: nucleoside-diphosphate kinase [Bacteroidales bacterium]|nr:nucleoside-diphosphate kinase [Bacteroidales bacterium]
MHNEFTFAFIKPNAVKNKKTGPILAMINESGFRLAAMKMIQLSEVQARTFYAVHAERPFFDELVKVYVLGSGHCNDTMP